MLATDDSIVEGIDASDMGESFYEPQWVQEGEWHPFLGMSAASSKSAGDEDLERSSGESGYTPAESEKNVSGSSAVRPVASP